MGPTQSPNGTGARVAKLAFEPLASALAHSAVVVVPALAPRRPRHKLPNPRDTKTKARMGEVLVGLQAAGPWASRTAHRAAAATKLGF